MAQYLSDHPDVFHSVPKEPFYWATDLPAAPHELRPTQDAYFAMFDGAKESVRMESSTSYLRSEAAVGSILTYDPNALFIVMLRNPVDVAQAFHMEQVYTQAEDITDFAKAWDLQEAREAGRSLPRQSKGGDFVLYRQVTDFAGQIARFYSRVPEEQRLTVFYDDFAEDPGLVYRHVLAFLGLPDDGRTEFSRIHGSRQQRFPALAKFVLYPPKPLAPAFRAARQLLLSKDIPGVAQLKSALKVSTPRSELSDEMVAKLHAHYDPQIARLAALTERDLTHWTKGQHGRTDGAA